MTDDKKISICFVSLKAYPLFNPDIKKVFGGAELDLYLLATELAKDPQFDVSFVLGDYGQNDIEMCENVRVLKSAKVEKNLFLQAHKIWQAMKIADAKIYMGESCSLGTALVALFCVLNKRSFVYRTASSIETNHEYYRQNIIRGIAFYWALRRASVIIAQNQSDKVGLVKNVGVDSVVIKNADKIPAQVSKDRDTILWVGRSAQVKRPELFIQLARDYPNYKFTMICQHTTGDKTYPQLVDAAKVIKNLEFIERVPFQEIEKWYMRAYLLVNTSDFEGFPNTFVQACKCGTPILSLNVNPDGFLSEQNCGLCAEGNWQIFGQMLGNILKPENFEKFSAAAYNYVRRNHNIDRIVQEYKKIFSNITQDSKR